MGNNENDDKVRALADKGYDVKKMFEESRAVVNPPVDIRKAFGMGQPKAHLHTSKRIQKMNVKDSMKTLTKAMTDDPAYAYGWHCSIAMAFYDQIANEFGHDEAHKVANAGATVFMKNCFGVETKAL